MSKTVTISITEYEELQEAYDFLMALQMAGVDNWDGYDEALNIFEGVTGNESS